MRDVRNRTCERQITWPPFPASPTHRNHGSFARSFHFPLLRSHRTSKLHSAFNKKLGYQVTDGLAWHLGLQNWSTRRTRQSLTEIPNRVTIHCLAVAYMHSLVTQESPQCDGVSPVQPAGPSLYPGRARRRHALLPLLCRSTSKMYIQNVRPVILYSTLVVLR